MEKSVAQQSIKNLSNELFSLDPSALITLFIIDISELLFSQGITSPTETMLQTNTIFKFHNNVNLTSNSIFWKGEEYIAAPIQAEGFEMNLKGSTPTPKLSLTVSDEGIPHLTRLKDRINSMTTDLVGAKVTRIRTFARFLDEVNFLDGVPPRNFAADPNSELPRDIYYIDRKSNENKNILEMELVPAFDLEGVRLPGRIVSANSCPWQYRGCGCLYEYASRKNTDIHGDGTLPVSAPPMANVHDEMVNTVITGVSFSDQGEYNLNQVYSKGNYVFIKHRGINYYFVSKINNNATQPPSSNEWLFDECGKKLNSCKMRWGNIGNSELPFGGWPSVNRFR